ncbi:MAG: ribonuclease P protein component [Anaerolinea sp.]|nr:ribonuclease P protein component [Anaerolinea sp.]
MNRKYRLTRTSDIQRVRRSGRSFAHPLLVLVVETGEPDKQFQLAFLASKSLGQAVNRNRAKRLLRAAFEPFVNSIKPGCNALVIAREDLLSSSFLDIEQAIEQMLKKARIMKENDATFGSKN